MTRSANGLEDAGSRAGVTETLRVPADLLSFCQQYLPASARIRLRKGEVLYRQGERAASIAVVEAGRLSVTMIRPDGQQFLIDIVGRGAMCGEAAVFDDEPRFSTAVAIEASTVIVMSRDDAFRLMSAHPELPPLILRTAAMKQRVLACRLSQIAQLPPEQRITELLSQITGPTRPQAFLTHDQIGELIGASRVTVTRAVQRLRRAGSLRTSRGGLELVMGAENRSG